MTQGFHRGRRGIVADLGEVERELLLSLLGQTCELLEDSVAEGTEAPAEDDHSFEAMMRRAGFSGAQEAEAPEPGETADDTAVRRLLPDGHHDDPELAAEFRRLTESGVRERKLGHLRRAIQVVSAAEDGRLRLAEPEAVSLLISMTDVRLVLADRLGLEDDEAAESFSDQVAGMDQDDPAFGLALGYEFLTWLQETLAVALTP